MEAVERLRSTEVLEPQRFFLIGGSRRKLRKFRERGETKDPLGETKDPLGETKDPLGETKDPRGRQGK